MVSALRHPKLSTPKMGQQERPSEPRASPPTVLEPLDGYRTENEVGTPASAFSAKQKRLVVFIAASAGWFSTASSFIYFPAIPFLSHDLGVPIEKINLTVTSYLVCSGIFPSLVASAADQYGRRPVFIASVGVYFAVNIGLAVQRSFAVLIVLRMLQSAAISGRLHALSQSRGVLI